MIICIFLLLCILTCCIEVVRISRKNKERYERMEKESYVQDTTSFITKKEKLLNEVIKIKDILEKRYKSY